MQPAITPKGCLDWDGKQRLEYIARYGAGLRLYGGLLQLEIEAGGQKLSLFSGEPFPLGEGLGFHFLPEKVLCLKIV